MTYLQDVIKEIEQDVIKEIEDRNEVPTRLAVLDSEGNLLGYKVDTCWTLSPDPEDYKVHPFQNTKPEGHLAKNLAFCFNESASKSLGTEDSWFQRFEDGVIVSVQSVSERNFGEELLRYRIVKEEDRYVARE